MPQYLLVTDTRFTGQATNHGLYGTKPVVSLGRSVRTFKPQDAQNQEIWGDGMQKQSVDLRLLEERQIVHRLLGAEAEPPFEDPEEMVRVWGRRWGVENDVGQLRMVLVARPGDEWKRMAAGGVWHEEAGSWIDAGGQWYWMDRDRPDIPKAQSQHDCLAETLRREGAEVVYLGDCLPHLTRSVFTRDVALVVPGGAIVCRMATSYRRGEEQAVSRGLAQLGMPILHTVRGRALVEGGSFAILDQKTAVLGLSHRINEEGASQVRRVLADLGMELITIELPGLMYHLDGVFVMVDYDKALINFNYLSRRFIEKLADKGIETIDVDPDEGLFAVNCLAVRPGRVVMSLHAVRTAEKLCKAGIEIVSVEYDEIPKSGGGIHCSTLPLVRDPL
jgi:N-dimethylarginine dimethylaminohydrolase